MMIKLLIGGSPCTFWSISQTQKRELQPEGTGWELFKNFLIAKSKFKPDYFLYENNESIPQSIKNQIEFELNNKLVSINSAVLSAQQRKRVYCFNWDVDSPQDKGVVVKDIIDQSSAEGYYDYTDKNPVLYDEIRDTSSKPIRVGHFGKGRQGERIHSELGKSTTLCANGGGGAAKTGLYKITNGDTFVIRKLTPIEAERCQTLPDNYTHGISDSQRYKCIGNGWTADVIIHILNGILKNVPKDEEIVVLSMYDGIATGRYCLDKMGFTNIKYYAYEIDRYAIQIAKKNYPDIIHLGDAYQVRNDSWALPDLEI